MTGPRYALHQSSAATSARMRQLLRMIVMDGTGRNADAPGYRIGGKTGTAEKPIAGGYARRSLVTTFAAAFPMDNPKYVIPREAPSFPVCARPPIPPRPWSRKW